MDIFLQFLPLMAVFFIGVLLKSTKQLSENDGSTLLRTIFYVGLPALIFLSITKTDFDSSLLLLCLLAPTVILISLAVLFLLRRSLLRSLDYRTFGAFLTGVVIMNTGFLIPFVESSYGEEGLMRLVLIDAFNAIATVTIVYGVVVSLGKKKADARYIMNKLLIAPPLWALVAALAFKVFGVTPPEVVMDTFGLIAKFVSPIILLALGLKFTLKIDKPKFVVMALILRFGLGVLIGLTFIKLLGLSGLDAQIVLFASLAPIGFNSITFSEMEKLDVKFAASQVSIGLIIALIAAPMIVQLTDLVK